MITHIGRYEVQAELGRGGFGNVYRAYDPNLDALVAIKRLKADTEPELIRRFRNEAASARKLRHQNIVTIYDFGEEEGSPYLVMELLEGEDLERITNSHRPLSLLQKLDIMMQIAAGLYHAHKNGVVHRDVKPANIMVLPDGMVKIVDFGIALLTQATAIRETPAGAILGTFGYMAPEHFIPPRAPSDVLTDIFAYGVTCYKLLTGFHPFPAADIGELMESIVHKQPAPVRKISPQCPEALEEAVVKMLAKDRDSRYQSLEDVRFDLGPIILDLERERVSELLAEARKLIAADELEAAQACVRQALEIDARNRTARELRERLQREVREKAVRPRIAALVNEGREQLEARHFDEAIQRFESALRLEKSNPEIHMLLDQARLAWQQAQRAARLVEEARRALDSGDLTAAHENAAEALSADPEHTQAVPLLETIRERIAARARARRLADGLSQAKGLILVQNFDTAIEALEHLQTDYPESAEAGQLLERARQEQELQARRLRLQAATDEAKELLRNRRWAEALERLSQMRAEFQESAELRELATYAEEELQAQKQAEAIQLATEQVQSLMQMRDFDAALERLRRTLADYPSASALRDLVQSVASAKAEHQRKTSLEEAIQQSSSLIAEGRFAEALDRIGAFVRAYGDVADLGTLRQQADEGLARQRREVAIRKVMLEAQILLDDGRPENATQVLQQGTVYFPGEPALTDLLGVAREQLRDQQRAEAISGTIAEAESLARGLQFDRALQLVDDGLERYAGADRLVRCREAILASRAAYERERIRQEAFDLAHRSQADRKFEEGLQAIDSAIAKVGDDPALLEVKRQLEVEQRATEVMDLVEQARTLLDRGQAEAATRILLTATVRYPAEEAIAQLKVVAEARLRERKRAEEIAELIRDTEEQVKTKLFDSALDRLDAALKQYGSAAELVNARETALAAKKAHEREQAIAEARARVSQLRTEGKLQEALRALKSALKKFVDDAGLLDLKKQIASDQEAARRAEQEREQAISRIAREADSFAKNRQFTQAVNALEEGLKEYPGAEPLLHARESALAAQAWAAALAQARWLHDRGDFQAALQAVDAALRKTPADREFQELKARIESDRDKQRCEPIERPLQDARERLQAGRIESALEALQQATAAVEKALHEFGDAAVLLKLKSQIESERQAVQRAEQQREQAISGIAKEAGRLANSGKFAEAADALEEGLKEYPGADALIRTRESVLAAQARVEVLAETRRLHDVGDFQTALRTLDAALRETPADREFQELKRQIESDQEKQRRAEGIGQILSAAQDLLRAGRIERAVETLEQAASTLEKALKEFADDAVLLDLKKRIEAGREAVRRAEEERARQRGEAISDIEGQAEIQLGAGDFERALHFLDFGLQQYPGEERLMRARETALKRRDEAVQQAVEEVQAMLDRTELGPAVSFFYRPTPRLGSDTRLTALLAEIERRRDEAVAHARDLHGQGHFAEAHEALLPALEIYLEKAHHVDSLITAEDRDVVELRARIEADRQHEEALAGVRNQAETLVAQSQYEEAIALLESRFPGEPRTQDLLTRARNELNAKQREELLQRAVTLGQARRFEEALDYVRQAIRQYGSTPAAIELLRGLQEELDLQKRREARDRDRDELLAIERKIPATRKFKLKGLATRAERIGASYTEDQEIAFIASRIREQVEAARSAPSKPLSWRWIAAGVAVVAAVATGLTVGPGLFHKPPAKPTITTVAVEIRTDPQGATVRLGDRSCVSPHCRFDLRPGPYQVEVQLKGYQPVQQPLIVDSAKPLGVVDLTLQPALPPHLPPQPGGSTPSTGTLLVRARVPGALVSVDNVPQGRTDANGEFRLQVEAKSHEVRVEKSAYQTPPPQRIKIVENRSQTALFNLVMQSATLELRGAPAGVEVRVRGTALGKTDGSHVFTASVPPGEGILEVRQGTANRQITERFDAGQTLAVDWPSVAPPKIPQTNPEDEKRALESRAWQQVQNSTDISTLERFLKSYGDGAHANEVRQKIQQLNQAAREQAAREVAQQAARDQALRDQAARDQATRDEAAHQQALREQADRQKLAAAQEAQAIRLALERFNAAFQHKQVRELKAIWPSARSPYTESVKIGGVSLRAIGDAKIDGGTASIDCELISTKTTPLKVMLQKQGDHWSIVDLTAP